MKRSVLGSTDSGIKIIRDGGEIWMTKHEIARLLGCFVAKIVSNIRSILKSEAMSESKVYRLHFYQNGNGIELYNLEMIIALAFRIRSQNAELFRQWIMERALRDNNWKIPVYIPLDGDTLPN